MTRAALPSFAALTLLLCASIAEAQSVPDTFDRLPLRDVDVYVVPDGGVEIKGRLIAFDQDSIAVWIDGRRWTFQRDDIRRIYRRGDSLTNGLRIGALAGGAAGVGLAIAMSFGACDDLFRDFGPGCVVGASLVFLVAIAPVSIAVGMLAGMSIDALHSGRTLIYQRRSGPAIGLAPIVTRQRQGLSVSIGW
jgi:hypothetical protein